MPSARGAPGSATTAAADALGLLACSVTTDTGRPRGPGVLALVGGIVLPYVLAVACPRLARAAGLLDSALALLVLAALGARVVALQPGAPLDRPQDVPLLSAASAFVFARSPLPRGAKL